MFSGSLQKKDEFVDAFSLAEDFLALGLDAEVFLQSQKRGNHRGRGLQVGFEQNGVENPQLIYVASFTG